MKIIKYNVIYESGGGDFYNDGIWTARKIPNTFRLIVEKIKEHGVGVYANHEVGYKKKVGSDTGHPVRYSDSDYDDYEFIVYFEQAGTPYYFERLTNAKL